ncbi:hypothetical protein Q7P37_007494 [Cladosporium fusiforme]
MPPTEFTCIFCIEQKSEALPRWISAERSERICDECARESIAPLFHQAIEHEHAYPPRWGNQTLDYWTFQDLLEENDKRKWHTKVREYAVHTERRLYCRHRDERSGEFCGEYLGEKGEGTVGCSSCLGRTCKSCGVSRYEAPGDMDEHMCELELEEDPFADMKKGRDYQQCPGCKMKITQRDGCNHMICTCKAHFCFICGRKVEPRFSGHWQPGGCPRYGRVQDGPLFDPAGWHSAGEDEDEDADAVAFAAREIARRQRLMTRYESLIRFFNNQVIREQRQIDNAATRHNLPRDWLAHAQMRISLWKAVSTNMDIAYRVVDPSWDIDAEDPVGILSQFEDRHRTIMRESDEARGRRQPDDDVVQISNMNLEFEIYLEAAEETIQDLRELTDD